MRTYFAFGLCIRSEFSIPELTTAEAGSGATVAVRYGNVPRALPALRRQNSMLQVGWDELIMTVPRAARYHLRGGREIIVDPFPGATERNVRLALLGSVMGALCHQRGGLPLHANAIEVAGCAVVIAGHSGAGKSTLALHFHNKGYRVLSDDVVAVSLRPDERPIAWPGVPRVRVWRDSAEALVPNVDALERVADGFEKYQLALRPMAPWEGLPLSKIYILCPSKGAEPDRSITRLHGSQALDAVMVFTYRRECLDLMDGADARFLRNLALLSQVPVFSVPWRKDFARLSGETTSLENHIFADEFAPSGM
jgi:hypothetical protein